MSLTTHVWGTLPISVRHLPETRNAVRADASRSHAASIKRYCKFALAIVLFTVVVAGIVALKSTIWIPHFNH